MEAIVLTVLSKGCLREAAGRKRVATRTTRRPEQYRQELQNMTSSKGKRRERGDAVGQALHGRRGDENESGRQKAASEGRFFFMILKHTP
jgi:hypothetical protein